MQVTKSPETALAAMEKAIARQCPATITYVDDDGQETVRTVEPYEVYETKNGDLIIRTLCRMRGHFRTFRPEGIRAYTVHRRARRVLDHTAYTLAT